MSIWQQRTVLDYNVQNYEKNHKDLSPNRGRRTLLRECQRTFGSKFGGNSNCLIVSEKTLVKGFIISSPEGMKNLQMKKQSMLK